jgi:aminobenzoyl-glutamate transport protein
MPRTVTGFAPLGLVLVIMLGAAVAERSGLFSALIRGAAAQRAAGAADADRRGHRHGVAPCLGRRLCRVHPARRHHLAAVGRHPLVGLAAAFAAVSGGFAGNITPGQLDVLLFGFTQEAARIIEPAGP